MSIGERIDYIYRRLAIVTPYEPPTKDNCLFGSGLRCQSPYCGYCVFRLSYLLSLHYFCTIVDLLSALQTP